MAKHRVFLFQWDAPSAKKRIEELRANGWAVQVESADGARGGTKLLHNPPDVAVFDLTVRPSHSRETANGVRSYKAGRTIPMVFVDGKDEDVRKTRAKVTDARFTTSAKLIQTLNSVIKVSHRRAHP